MRTHKLHFAVLSLCSIAALGLSACESEDSAPEAATTTADTVSPDSSGVLDVSGADGSDQTDEGDGIDGLDGSDGSDDSDTADGVDGSDETDGVIVDDVVESDTSEPDDVSDEPDVSIRPPVVATYDTFIGDWEMEPGKETTKCVVKRLSNEDEVWVTGITTDLGQGSHHLIVYRSDETEEQPEPFNCTPFVETLGGQTIPLMITQITEETLELPDGVAFKFQPNQMVRIEAHYLNYYPENITAHADVEFHTIDEADVEAEANMLFYGTPDFSIPPGDTYSTPWFFLDVWKDAKVFGLTGHTHQYGTNVEIFHGTDVDDDSNEVYPMEQPFLWDEAPLLQFDPPLTFENGEGFRYRCSWENTSDKNVTFGESANKEMCFFWAYYYSAPSKGYRMCINPGSLFTELGDQICCPDSFVCDLIQDFLADGL